VQVTQPQARLLSVRLRALPYAVKKRYWDQLHALVAELDLSQLVYLTGYVGLKLLHTI